MADPIDDMIARDIQGEIDKKTQQQAEQAASNPYESYESTYDVMDYSGIGQGRAPKVSSQEKVKFNKVKGRDGRWKVLATDTSGNFLNLDKGGQSDSYLAQAAQRAGFNPNDVVFRGDDAKYLHNQLNNLTTQHKAKQDIIEKEKQALLIDKQRQDRMSSAIGLENQIKQGLYGNAATGDIGDVARYGQSIDRQLSRGLEDLGVQGDEVREGLGSRLSTTGMSRSSIAQKGFEDVEMQELEGKAQLRANAQSSKENIEKQRVKIEEKLASIKAEREKVFGDATQSALYDEVMKTQQQSLEQMYTQLETNNQINQAEAEAHRKLIGDIFNSVVSIGMKAFGA